MDIRETVIQENIKKQENESHSVKELTTQGEQLACRCLERQASSCPASRLRTPHGQA
jgi:hypothetical protein